MADATLTTSIDELSSIAIAEARDTILNSADLRNYVTRLTVPQGSLSIRVPKLGSLTASALTEGQSAANQEFTSTGTLLTPTTNAVVQISLTDLAGASAPQTAARAGRAMGQAIVKKINTDIAGLFDGFSTSLGTTNTDISEETIRKAKRVLMENNAPGPYYLVVSCRVFEDIMQIYSSNLTETSDRLRDAVLNGEAPSIYGVNVVVTSSGLEEDGNGDYKVGLFSSEALAFAETEGWGVDGLKLERQRDASLIGEKWVMSAAYDYKEIDDTYGCEIIADGD